MTAMPERMRGVPRAIVVWWFRSRGAEHEAQARGLLKALEAQCPLQVHAAPVVGPVKAWRYALRRHYPAGALPDPDLLLGTGRESHGALLAARWARGGRIVTLSKPRLPRWLFDLCIVPEHAGGRNAPRMIATRGALPQPSVPRLRTAGSGLIVIGGPSKDHRWLDDELLGQLRAILARHPDQRWFVTTTSATLPETEQRLQALAGANIHVVPHYEAEPNWWLARLHEAEQVWVSEDSLAVIYQALNAGAATGVLPVARRKPSRELASLQDLVVWFPDWQAGTALRAPPPGFNEAARCAAEIYRRWLGSASSPRAAAHAVLPREQTPRARNADRL